MENNLLEALTRNSVYIFTFDVTANLVEEPIISRSGVNFTDILGLEVPCSFDDMMERAFGEVLQCRYTSESAETNISRQILLDAYENGKTRLEANIYYAAWNKYVRITYLLFREPENSHVLAYVICDDVTRLEEMRGDSLNLDNTNLKRERDDLTRRNSDLTEERDNLTRRNSDPTEERDDLTRRNSDLTEERDNLTRRNSDLTEERDNLTRKNSDLTEERDDLTRRNSDLTEERDDLTRRNSDLTEERDDLTRRNSDLTEERDDLTRRNSDLTEERDDLTRRNSDLTEERDDLTKDNDNLTEQRNVLSEENGELIRAADAVHSILNAGSFVCTYNLDGNKMLGIKYSEAMRKLHGFASENEFPD